MTAPSYGVTHRARVLRAGSASGSYLVEIPALAPERAFGPVASTVPELAAGDRVLLTQIGTSQSDLVIIGKLPPTPFDAHLPLSIDNVAGLRTALDNRQPLDPELTTIAGLPVVNDSVLQGKSGLWATRTPSQLKADLALSAADVGLPHLHDPLVVVKSVDESLSDSTVLRSDAELTLAVEANATYQMTCLLLYIGAPSTAGDLKMDWLIPAGADLLWASFAVNSGALTTYDVVLQTNTEVRVYGTNGVTPMTMRPGGILTVGNTAGTVALRWAQNSAHSIPTIMKAKSLLRLDRIA